MNVNTPEQIALVKGVYGEPVDVPTGRLLIAGRAGSGKTNLLNLLALHYERAGLAVYRYSRCPWDGIEVPGIRGALDLLGAPRVGRAVLLDDVRRDNGPEENLEERKAFNRLLSWTKTTRSAVALATHYADESLPFMHEELGVTLFMEPFNERSTALGGGVRRLVAEASRKAQRAAFLAKTTVPSGPGAVAVVRGETVTFGRVPLVEA